jgi:UDP-N-acetylglucosamine 4,6-dehydratase
VRKYDNYFRLPADTRELNYDKYFTDGNEQMNDTKEYNSHNAKILNVEEIKNLLLSLEFIKEKQYKLF